MKRSLLFCFLCTLVSFTTFSQNILNVNVPEWGGWSNYPANIVEAEFQVEPKGLYMEVGMFLTISAPEQMFSNWDTLEIVLDFNLPSEAIIHDSWLWMNDSLIVKADILDISQATEIYEDIVDRNQDPSLLYKKDNGGYQIRIFPLAGDESRKIKITYLTPAIWEEDAVSTWLPFDILNASEVPLESARIISVHDEQWGAPYLKGAEDVVFQSTVDPDMGTVWIYQLDHTLFSSPIQFAVESPLLNQSTYFKIQEGENESFFQMAYQPSLQEYNTLEKQVVVVFDHDASMAKVNKSQLFGVVKEELLKNFQDNDQLNFVFSGLNSNLVSEDWISGHPDSLNAVFAALGDDPISDNSDLLASIETAIGFIQSNDGVGEILVLCTNSSSYLNGYVNEIESAIGGDDITIHMVNYQTEEYYWESVWDGPDEVAYLNKYFFQELTSMTGGSYFNLPESNMFLWELITSSIQSFNAYQFPFDVNFNFSGGFVYDTYFQTSNQQSQAPNKPVLQVGKIVGDMPLSFDYSSFIDGNLTNVEVAINEAEAMFNDTLMREMWYGNHLQYLESTAVNAFEIQEIVEQSISERVLSKYTAFLALELSQGGEPCINCWSYNDVILPLVEELPDEEEIIMVSASPNPFETNCQIVVELKNSNGVGFVELAVFDHLGRLLKKDKVDAVEGSSILTYHWDGRDLNNQELAPGIYYVQIKSGTNIQTTKLIKI